MADTIPNDALGWRLAFPTLSAVRGEWKDVSTVNKFGMNDEIGTSVEDLWSQGGEWVPPTQARIHAIVSTDVADDGFGTAGTGAQTVLVQGLDANYNPISETVILNGTAAVNTTKAYLRVFRMIVTLSGSGQVNAGVITATAATDATVTAAIPVGIAQTMMAIYTVPAGKTAYVLNYYCSIGKRTAAACDVALLVMPFGTNTWNHKHVTGGNSLGTTSYNHQFFAPYRVTEKSDIKMHAQSSVADTSVDGGFDLLLITEG